MLRGNGFAAQPEVLLTQCDPYNKQLKCRGPEEAGLGLFLPPEMGVSVA
jgi:hypothetical protein